jgi:hypothetical protein
MRGVRPDRRFKAAMINLSEIAQKKGSRVTVFSASAAEASQSSRSTNAKKTKREHYELGNSETSSSLAADGADSDRWAHSWRERFEGDRADRACGRFGHAHALGDLENLSTRTSCGRSDFADADPSVPPRFTAETPSLATHGSRRRHFRAPFLRDCQVLIHDALAK